MYAVVAGQKRYAVFQSVSCNRILVPARSSSLCAANGLMVRRVQLYIAPANRHRVHEGSAVHIGSVPQRGLRLDHCTRGGSNCRLDRDESRCDIATERHIIIASFSKLLDLKSHLTLS